MSETEFKSTEAAWQMAWKLIGAAQHKGITSDAIAQTAGLFALAAAVSDIAAAMREANAAYDEVSRKISEQAKINES